MNRKFFVSSVAYSCVALILSSGGAFAEGKVLGSADAGSVNNRLNLVEDGDPEIPTGEIMVGGATAVIVLMGGDSGSSTTTTTSSGD